MFRHPIKGLPNWVLNFLFTLQLSPLRNSVCLKYRRIWVYLKLPWKNKIREVFLRPKLVLVSEFICCSSTINYFYTAAFSCKYRFVNFVLYFRKCLLDSSDLKSFVIWGSSVSELLDLSAIWLWVLSLVELDNYGLYPRTFMKFKPEGPLVKFQNVNSDLKFNRFWL